MKKIKILIIMIISIFVLTGCNDDIAEDKKEFYNGSRLLSDQNHVYTTKTLEEFVEILDAQKEGKYINDEGKKVDADESKDQHKTVSLFGQFGNDNAEILIEYSNKIAKELGIKEIIFVNISSGYNDYKTHFDGQVPSDDEEKEITEVEKDSNAYYYEQLAKTYYELKPDKFKGDKYYSAIWPYKQKFSDLEDTDKEIGKDQKEESFIEPIEDNGYIEDAYRLEDKLLSVFKKGKLIDAYLANEEAIENLQDIYDKDDEKWKLKEVKDDNGKPYKPYECPIEGKNCGENEDKNQNLSLHIRNLLKQYK